jgi:hypothetical protein
VTVTAGAARTAIPVSRARERRALFGVLVWSAVVVTGAIVAALLELTGHDISISAPPLHARWQPDVRPQVALVVAIGALSVGGLPLLTTRASWRVMVIGSTLTAVVFAVGLASTRGWGRLVGPVLKKREYLSALPQVHDVGTFLGTFVERLPTYPTHVQGHPPGPVLVALGLRGVGLAGPGWFAAVLIAGGALVVPAALVSVRELAGDGWARSAAPFVALAPAAVWMVTSADALFAGVGAVGVALVIVSTGRRGPACDLLAAVGGIVLGLAAFLSYGLVLLGVVPLVVAWRRRRPRAIAAAAAGAALVVVGFAASGFWWFDGFLATRDRYGAGIASRRGYLEFFVIDLAALAVMLGPAFGAGLATLRDRRVWLLCGGALGAVSLALASGLAKWEVERIWLPFAPWLLVACAGLGASGVAVTALRRPIDTVGPGAPRGWLAAQVGVAILIEVLVRTPW